MIPASVHDDHVGAEPAMKALLQADSLFHPTQPYTTAVLRNQVVVLLM